MTYQEHKTSDTSQIHRYGSEPKSFHINNPTNFFRDEQP
jgi:hypothetical protein